MIRVLLARMSPAGVISKPLGPPPVAPPVGLIYIAGAMRQWCKAEVDVRVGSLSMDVDGIDDIPQRISTHEPDIVGLSALTIDESRMFECARAIKSVSERIIVIAGGPHASLDPERCLSEPCIDWAAIGEGERTMVEFVDAIDAGRDPREIPGLAYREADRVVRSAPREPIAVLDELPPPAWDLTSLNLYSQLFNFHDLPILAPPYAPVTTMRGCPYRCSYCHNIFGRKARLHGAQRVVDDLQSLHDEYGVREFHIVDDIFNVDGERLVAICDGIIRSGMDVRIAFPNGLRGDILTRTHLEKLREAGCYSLTLALETASPRIQKLVRKNLNIERVLENGSIASELGMITHCYVMLGFPTETLEEMEHTIQTVVESDFDLPRIFTVCPFPGTEMHDLALQHGFEPRVSCGDGWDYDRAAVNASTIPDEQLAGIVKQSQERIFSHPPRVERLRRVIDLYGRPSDPYFKLGPWNIVKPLLGGEYSAPEQPRVVLAMFHTLAREGRFSGNMQLSLLSGELDRLGIDHEMIAMIMRPSDRAQNDRTVEEFRELMKRWKPDHIVMYAMWLPWFADALAKETGARVMSLDAAQSGDIPPELRVLDPQAAVIATVAGATSLEEAITKLHTGDTVTRFVPRFRYRFIGTDEPIEQKMGFVSLLSCPYDAQIAENPVYADLPLGEDVSRRGCSYCNGARHYEPLPDAEKQRALSHQIRWLQKELPALEEIAVPFPEDYIEPLTGAFREAASAGLKPVVLSGQFRSESIVQKERAIDEMLTAAEAASIEFHMNVVGLESFLDEDLQLFNRGTAQDVIEALAALRRLRNSHDPATFMPTTVGSFILFHPWQTIERIRLNVQAMKREGISGIFHSININDMRFHTGVAMYHLAAKDGLLSAGDDESVQDVPLGGYFAESPWRFSDEATARVHRLFTGLMNRSDDRVGLLEACLRVEEEHPKTVLDPEIVTRSMENLVRYVTSLPLPRSGRRHLVRIGSVANTGYPRDIWRGERFTDDFDDAASQIEGIERIDSTRVTLGGPEPTLVRWMPDLVATLSARGAAEIEVLTYGRMLAYPKYATALAASGADLITLLLHHPEADGHDKAVRVPGCFEQATSGLRSIREFSSGGVRTAIAAVVGPENRDHLEEMADLAKSLGCVEFRLIVPLANVDLGHVDDTIDRMQSGLRYAASVGLASGFDSDLNLAFSF